MPVSPTLPPFGRSALLLDLDGTLLDIAGTPDLVIVPPTLAPSLVALCQALDGALAVITGRPADQVDTLLPGVVPTVSGEHGGAYRFTPGAALVRAALPELPPGLLDGAAAAAAAHPGVVLEAKARGFVLHYRAVPSAGPGVHAALAALVAPHPQLQLMPAAMAWEVRPHGADKGLAVRTIMAQPAFAGRLPVFIGDDVTDLDGMAAADSLGGCGLFVPDMFGSAGAVRNWLVRSVGGWAPLQA